MQLEHAATPQRLVGLADWDRARWLELADRVLDGVVPFRSTGGGRITPPGAEGGYGRAVDGLEGFARTFLLAAFRIAGDRGVGLDALVERYREGVVTGVDPDAADRWVRIDEHAQAKVEAASLALALDLTRPWIWDRLDATTQQRVIAYLSPVVGDDTYPRTNWLWFRVVVQTFLRSVGGPWSADDVAADLALHDALTREDGWISDGFERSYDHYVGWALHVYPVLWARMTGAAELAAPRHTADVAALDRYLQDAVALVGGDGSPLVQGRSLIYRFAAAAPFWVGALAEVPTVPLGQLRRAASSMVAHFVDRGAPDADDLLTLGWYGEWRALAQSYSGTGSPYWAVKGLMGVLLPADHPVWTAPSAPLPIERGDVLREVRSAGWVLVGTADDGIVRIVNHGTDHALEGALVGDSPLYARIGYATAAAPLADLAAWEQPLEQSVALVDAAGRATHRAAMRLVGTRIDSDGTGIAASVATAHWITPRPSATRHGSGLDGDVTIAGELEVQSIVRGAHEMRLWRVRSLAPGLDAAALDVRVGGWALAGAAVDRDVVGDTAWALGDRAQSGIRGLVGDGAVSLAERDEASPFGPVAVVPVLRQPVVVGAWRAAIVTLGGTADTPDLAAAALRLDGDTATITWPDGQTTSSRLLDSDPDAPGTEHRTDPTTGTDDRTKE